MRSGSTLDRSFREASTPEALEDDDGDDERDDRDEHPAGGELVELRQAVDLRAPVVQTQCYRVQLLVCQHDERQEEVVPDGDELEQEDRHERGRHEPHGHGEERADLAGTVDAGGLDDLVGHARRREQP
ncbi:hypothetical protein BACI9J_240001 [Bacillus altitudinis]|nr:hypothetical protein BACI9J_240001 [Bacillus altitudinis]